MTFAVVEVLWTRPVDVSAALACSAAEQARLAALRPDDAQLVSTGRALLRGAVAAELGVDPRDVRVDAECPDCSRPHGRPVVVTPQDAPHVSIAHATGIVVVALTHAGPVGCDVEPITARTPPDVTIEHWTRIEAVAKALGTGLRIEPSEVNLLREDVVVHEFRVEDYLGCVAVHTNEDVGLSVRHVDDALLQWAMPERSSRTATG